MQFGSVWLMFGKSVTGNPMGERAGHVPTNYGPPLANSINVQLFTVSLPLFTFTVDDTKNPEPFAFPNFSFRIKKESVPRRKKDEKTNVEPWWRKENNHLNPVCYITFPSTSVNLYSSGIVPSWIFFFFFVFYSSFLRRRQNLHMFSIPIGEKSFPESCLAQQKEDKLLILINSILND